MRAFLAMAVAAPDPRDVGRTLLLSEEGPTVGALADPSLQEEIAAAEKING